MNILVVEDEMNILKSLTITFEIEGWKVKGLQNLPSLLTLLETKSFYPNVIVLDRILGGEDSAVLIEKIKTTFIDTRILILSAIDTGTEKARLLDMGADDYLSKPFSSSELVSRIRVLQRRVSLVKSQDEIAIGNVTLNQYLRSAAINGQNLQLTQKEFQLLSLFASNPGKVFPRDILLDKVWDADKENESKVVEATMNNLRRKLEAGNTSLRIKNIRNVGYWLEA